MENNPYISKVEIRGLHGAADLCWTLSKGVNILSGINGSGKSTVLQAISELLVTGQFKSNPSKPLNSIDIFFEDGRTISSSSPNAIHDNFIDIVSTFDSSMKSMEALQKLTDNRVKTELDWELYRAIERLLRYQLKLGKRAIEILMKNNDREELSVMLSEKILFYDILDELFAESQKSVIRDVDELCFMYKNIQLTPYQLSSGEKQLIIILTLALTQGRNPYIMILDEPEISLHFEWQRKLIDKVFQLNPNIQLITATHSPAIIMEGWMDKVTDIRDLIV